MQNLMDWEFVQRLEKVSKIKEFKLGELQEYK